MQVIFVNYIFGGNHHLPVDVSLSVDESLSVEESLSVCRQSGTISCSTAADRVPRVNLDPRFDRMLSNACVM